MKVPTLLLSFLLIASILLTVALTFSFSSKPGGSNKKRIEEEHVPLILLSFDGFRYDYVSRGLTPTIESFMAAGVTVPYMKASYPTLTFPNHYTIVTGLYPESHGIIANSFYDDDFGALFCLSCDSKNEGRWWGGTPIWNAAELQGKTSATLYWPGSDADIQDMHPTYWFPYNGSASFDDRVKQVLEWLSYDEDDVTKPRPDIICAYFDEPDHSGHNDGPDSQEVNDALVVMDGVLNDLLKGIEDMNLTNFVNIVLLADHGMATASVSTIVHLEEYLPNVEDQAYVFYSAFSRISLDDPSDEALKSEMKHNLSCQDSNMRQYEPSELPKRFHFSNNPSRIEDIILDLNPGYTVQVHSNFSLSGQHGYDNYFSVMQPMFSARGPDFKNEKIFEPFQNIELYNMLCYLIGIVPPPNNGTEGSLYHLLQSPPPYPPTDEQMLPPYAPFPDDDVLLDRLDTSGCDGDLTEIEQWLYALDLSDTEVRDTVQFHLPWSLQYRPNVTYFPDVPPEVIGSDMILLVHSDHVTGYSPTLKQALWTSFTVENLPAGTSESSWNSDPRLRKEQSATCDSYENLMKQNITMQPLFPPRFSQDSSLERIPYMISNVVPMTENLSFHWGNLIGILATWAESPVSPLNVVIGLIFDNNSDSYPDESDYYGAPPNVPSDLFMVATRCNDSVSSLENCPPQSLDAMAFIFQENQEFSNCLSEKNYTREFSARVRDVEIATNLEFYPQNLDYEEKVKLTTRIHSHIWSVE